MWTAIAVACGLASLAGYAVFDAFSGFIVAATTAVAAGGMLAMVVDTMIPEAFDRTQDWARRFLVLGFFDFVHINRLIQPRYDIRKIAEDFESRSNFHLTSHPGSGINRFQWQEWSWAIIA